MHIKNNIKQTYITHNNPPPLKETFTPRITILLVMIEPALQIAHDLVLKMNTCPLAEDQ